MPRPTHKLLITAVTASLLAAHRPGGSESPAAPPPAQAATLQQQSLSLDGASRVLAAAVAEARIRSAGGAIAVVDSGGHLITLARLDGTFAAGAEVSIGKARTAAIFKKPTKAFEDSINGGRVALSAVAQMTPLQGGVPIVIEGQVVGAIGVSGAHTQVEDEQIAMAGAAAVAPPGPTAAR